MLALGLDIYQWLDLELPDGRKISIQLVRTGFQGARLGIEAPKDIQVVRRHAKRREPAVSVNSCCDSYPQWVR